MRLEQLAFFVSVLGGFEVSMVTLALAVAHLQMSKLFPPKSQSDTQTPRRRIRNNYRYHS